MGTARADVYEELSNNLYKDDAVVGEAAGIAMGLVMLGTNSAQSIQDMLGYAQETQHEKILRGLAIGIALCVYGRLEEANSLIETLMQDKDAILRRSGMYAIAMAYCGTGNSEAIRRLLYVAVSDVNDDVRRAAVEALGFLLFRTPEQCPSMVALLSESYNPHVRYGAAMALGIACAGTGSKEALAVLEPMLNDAVNYVRQGVLIAMSLICIQHTEATCPKVKTLRETLIKVVTDKHEDVMAKFGAILAQGILDAGKIFILDFKKYQIYRVVNRGLELFFEIFCKNFQVKILNGK
jgi:26S proteasome regulatory subunit N2